MKPFALAWATGDCLTWLTRIVENRLMFPLTKSWLKFWLQKESTRVAQTFWRWAFSILDSRSRERISSTGFICLELLCSFRKLALIFFQISVAEYILFKTGKKQQNVNLDRQVKLCKFKKVFSCGWRPSFELVNNGYKRKKVGGGKVNNKGDTGRWSTR